MLYIIATVDTENLQTPFWNGQYRQDMLDYYDQGKPLATTKLADIFQSFQVEGVFFLTVSEADKLGEERMKKLVRKLQERNQDIQIHSHPVWSDRRNPPRPFMNQYSLDEQKRLLQEMKRRLHSWTGQQPIAHRAGAYAIDTNTLIALKEADIPLDASMFYQHPHARITWSRNAVCAKNGLVEIPVTGLFRWKILDFGLFGIPLEKRRFVKTDLDHMSLQELLFFVREAKERDIRVMTLFLHSYSLMRHDKHYRKFMAHEANEKKLISFLGACKKDPEIQFISLGQFWELYREDPSRFAGSDEVPELTVRESFYKKALKKLGRVLLKQRA